jgi:hypothetical protein
VIARIIRDLQNLKKQARAWSLTGKYVHDHIYRLQHH